jgi:hypothetical protein
MVEGENAHAMPMNTRRPPHPRIGELIVDGNLQRIALVGEKWGAWKLAICYTRTAVESIRCDVCVSDIESVVLSVGECGGCLGY